MISEIEQDAVPTLSSISSTTLAYSVPATLDASLLLKTGKHAATSGHLLLLLSLLECSFLWTPTWLIPLPLSETSSLSSSEGAFSWPPLFLLKTPVFSKILDPTLVWSWHLSLPYIVFSHIVYRTYYIWKVALPYACKLCNYKQLITFSHCSIPKVQHTVGMQ